MDLEKLFELFSKIFKFFVCELINIFIKPFYISFSLLLRDKIVLQRVDFPQPDSPTIPNVDPF